MKKNNLLKLFFYFNTFLFISFIFLSNHTLSYSMSETSAINYYLQQNAVGEFVSDFHDDAVHKTYHDYGDVLSATMTVKDNVLYFTRKVTNRTTVTDDLTHLTTVDTPEESAETTKVCPLKDIQTVLVVLNNDTSITNHFTQFEVQTNNPESTFNFYVHSGADQRAFTQLLFQLRDAAAAEITPPNAPDQKPKIPAIKPHGPPVLNDDAVE